MIQRKLGRIQNHDERSRQYSFAPRRAHRYASIQHELSTRILDQGELGSCTGNAAAACFNATMFRPVRDDRNEGKLLTQADAVHIYSRATHFDEIINVEYPPVDCGSSGLGSAKASQELGYIDRYTHCFSFDQFCAAIQEQPVSVGTVWTESMWTPKNGLAQVGSLANAELLGGHQYLAYGIDYKSMTIRFRNSWGKEWGLRGDFWLTFEDFTRLLAAGGDATVLHGTDLP